MFTHFLCLQRLMTSRAVMTHQNPHIQTFHWNAFDCDLCRKPYPFIYKTSSGENFCLLQFKCDEKSDFLVLEVENYEADEKSQKTIFILKPSFA